MTDSTPGHWPVIAPLWTRVGPPLKPGPVDVALFQEAVDAALERAGPTPRALILGVTPELFGLRWPAGVDLAAVDRSAAMIAHVWPGPAHAAHHGAWTELPFPRASLDLVLCDGGLAMLAHPDAQADLARELARVVVPGGRVALRLYTPGDAPRSVDEVLDAIGAGRLASLDAAKLALWGALHRSVTEGVAPRDVRAAMIDRFGSLDAVAAATGWPLDHVRALDAHRDSAARYHLTDAAEASRLFAPSFRHLRTIVPDYPLGSQCPHVTFERVA